jgi:lipoyl(octanoyl) transferase
VIVRGFRPADYRSTLEAMRAFTQARTPDTPDEIWLVEHEPVFTLGLAAKEEHLLAPGAIPVIRTERGGQVTYHGPGQVLAYVLIDLRRRGLTVRGLVDRLEQAVIGLLAGRGLPAVRRADAPGVYLAERDGAPGAKIASLGLKVTRGCSFHGVALNVAMDLEPFSRINPCGYPGLAVADLRGRLGEIDLADVAAELEAGWPNASKASTAAHDLAHSRSGSTRLRSQRQAEGGCQDLPHPDQGGAGGRDPEEALLDPREGRLAQLALRRDQADPARAPAAHRLRGGLLPEHRRMLRARHRHLHDHGRQVHPALPLLRRRTRPPRSPRPRRAGQPGADHRRAQAVVRGDHQRRPRRSARRWRGALRRLHPGGARTVAGDPHRGPGPRFPRPARPRARDPRSGADGRHEPQPRDRAAAVPERRGPAPTMRTR